MTITQPDLVSRYLNGERDFAGIDLTDTALGGANLKGADFSYADLTGLDLSKASLRGVDLSYARLSKVNLTAADLRGAILIGTDLRDAILADADLSEAEYVVGVTRFPTGFSPEQAHMHRIETHEKANESPMSFE
ncbi:MAG: pentapeptide repeat-containing protein [Cyanobacteria bacterium J06626_23]